MLLVPSRRPTFHNSFHTIVHSNQTGSKKKVHDTMPKTPPDSRFREIYLPTYYYLARNPSTNLLKSQFDGFPEILDRKYSQPKIILSKREMTTDIGIISTDFTRKKYAKSAPPEQAGPKSTYLPPASCCVKTFCYPFDSL